MDAYLRTSEPASIHLKEKRRGNNERRNEGDNDAEKMGKSTDETDNIPIFLHFAQFPRIGSYSFKQKFYPLKDVSNVSTFAIYRGSVI